MASGKLKIFFGYSAGVGKTYAMLKEARELKASGVDVVIGYVEPHARPDTMALCEGLEAVELKIINYHGIRIAEFDVDKALARRPEIIIVDELAHTNAESSKHAKRYQDVLELINSGVSVYTTVNVQHLEGLNDIIDSATMVKVGETVPDEIFDRADDVELIDIEPAELMERLKSGKVYHGEKIVAALDNFFTEEHLNNLREVSMRRCADRIVRQKTVSEIAPKILALISPSPSSQKNIRIAAQMARNYHCKFSAMYVERSGELDDESAKNLKEHIKLVGDLDGEIVIKYGDSVVEIIETYVKINGITNIIIGKTWQSIGKKVGFEEQIIAVLPDVEVLIVPDKQSGSAKNKRIKLALSDVNKIVTAVFEAVFVAAIGIFFVSKIAAIVCLGVLTVACFGFFMYERETRIKLNKRFRQSNRALDCINLLMAQKAAADTHEEIVRIASVVAETLERSVLISKDGDSVIRKYDGEDIAFWSSRSEAAILDWCVANDKPAGIGTDTLRNAKAIYFPIELSQTSVACIAIACEKGKLSVTDKMLFSQIKKTLAILLK